MSCAFRNKKWDISLLIVEDERHMLETLAEFLEENVRELYCAENGEEGLELFNLHRPDVVITDIQMPVMNGLDMARAIKNTEPDVQIIVISAYADSRYLEESIRIDASQFILKPFKMENIVSALERCVDFVFLKRKVRKQHDQLMRNKARYRAVSEHVPFGILFFDQNGVPQFANEKFHEITGYGLSDFSDNKRNLASLFPDRQHRQRNIGSVRKKKNGDFQTAASIICGDGSEKTVQVSRVDLDGGSTIFICCDATEPTKAEEELTRYRERLEELVSERTVTLQKLNLQYQQEIEERKRAEKNLEGAMKQLLTSQKELRNLSRHLERVREEERKRVAREIHDELGQAFSGLTMGLRKLFSITAHIEDEEERRQFLDAIKTTIDIAQGGVRSMRRIISDLRPAVLDDLGLGAAMEWLLNDFESKSGIRCLFEGAVDEIDLDERRAIIIFRILQESLANILHHARASEVRLRVWEGRDMLQMEVEDNGRGVDADDLEKVDSFGILGMRERALGVGGTVSVTGKREKGTTVRVELPKNH